VNLCDASNRDMYGVVDSLRRADKFHGLDTRCVHYASIVGTARRVLLSL